MARPRIPNPKIPQIAIAVPNYVLIQLRALAAREGVSIRYIVLRALPSVGVHVDDADLEIDRRQARPKGTRQHYAMRLPRGSSKGD